MRGKRGGWRKRGKNGRNCARGEKWKGNEGKEDDRKKGKEGGRCIDILGETGLLRKGKGRECAWRQR